jgi:hypothetical protein
MMAASLYIGPSTEITIRRLAWRAMLVLAGAVAGSAIWFTILQIWVIGDFCPYCMTLHITGLLLAVLVFRQAIRESDDHSNGISPLPAMGMALTGLTLAGILAACQFGFRTSAVYGDGKSQDTMPALDYHNVPIVGSPDAPYVVTVLFDYQCSHCQKIHFMLNEAVHRYNGKLAFALCPAPLNSECNPYIPPNSNAFKNSCELARIGLAVWVANRERFADFENWMFTFESGDSWHPRSVTTVRTKALELVGQMNFDAARTDPWIVNYMQTCIRIYGQTLQGGKGGIPKLVYGSRWIIPEPYNADELIRILQESLDLPKP